MVAANKQMIWIRVHVMSSEPVLKWQGEGATFTLWRQTEAVWCELTSHSDSEAAGSFVSRAVKHSVGHLVEPLWEVWFRSFPFQDNAAMKKKKSDSALIRHLFKEDQSLTGAKSKKKTKKKRRLGRLAEAGLTLWGCRLRCRHPLACPRSLGLSAFLAPPTCLSHKDTWSLEGPYLQNEIFFHWGHFITTGNKVQSLKQWCLLLGVCCLAVFKCQSAYLKFLYFFWLCHAVKAFSTIWHLFHISAEILLMFSCTQDHMRFCWILSEVSQSRWEGQTLDKSGT